MPEGMSAFSRFGVDEGLLCGYNGNIRSYFNEEKERKERKMAFSCVMYWKEECDGCRGCMMERWEKDI